MTHDETERSEQRVRAYRLVLLFGIVAALGDVVYEGGRSVAGPFLLVLGASAFMVSFIAGFGEFVGYAIRIATGYLADKTRQYWIFVLTGYLLIGAIPLLVLAGSWEIAACLLIAERIGKAVRSPAKDAILSHATISVGRGWGFGLHEALDQIGAVAGPLLFVAALAANGNYRGGFALLAIPFVLLIIALAAAWKSMPDPLAFEAGVRAPRMQDTKAGETRRLRLYAVFTALTMAGFVVFPLLAFHYKALGIIPDAEIPLFYAIAMGVDAVAALAIGKAYDRYGIGVLTLVPVTGILIALVAFSPSYPVALAGAVLWGISMGMQETVLRAAVADLTAMGERGFAYGIFNTIYGGAWFAGSMAIGALYTLGPVYAAGFMVLLQAAALPVLLRLVIDKGRP
ncbi:MFS transporter [Methanoregula formicica]|uniref:Arabinose efflux permease family protein n=1 Tax=Methanoregula formicica (strain DSM 22288 / NBRC 105244 / SMSP) TaxID=593750 RepID=L0HCL8_METFS|nr:MFS transporter [Methanoregula formicica]AGB01546.1 arabinose efflux permease family protein [Methanoregula formicica SMSP]